jgi:hypothetical protein
MAPAAISTVSIATVSMVIMGRTVRIAVPVIPTSASTVIVNDTARQQDE